ncbi:DMT family transporter [Paenibacillus sp. ACRRX]|uniref:DMT family transporter n=1 Tax=unclassified Paenibacillus TaxID=185978 RepID=UPI001EF6A820|nr:MULTISPECIES: DMT family transporter [unclassified Paenibacillus]MCG7407246.1 DMT family transporter [Paenibacillus sp. ACRRX]MDK8180465.1 DMT family transporter [Paenibacillus sp. UMB4589-SE434]
MENRLNVDQGRMGSSRTGVWLVAMGAALWGIGPLFRVLLLELLTSSQIVLIEHLILFVFAAPVLWLHRHELKGCSWRHLFALLFISWGGSVFATIMFTDAFAQGNPNGVLLLQKLQPIFAVLLARILLKESLPKGFSSLLLLAVIGTYLLTFGWSSPVGHMSDVIGTSSLLALGAAFLWGGSTVMGRYMLGKMKYETVTSLRFLLALPLLFVITWTEAPSWNVPGSEWGTVTFYILLQALLPGLVSLLLYYRGLSTTKASYATLAELSFPLVGMLMNWIVFQEIVTTAQVTGFALIWVALYLVSRQQ